MAHFVFVKYSLIVSYVRNFAEYVHLADIIFLISDYIFPWTTL